MLQHNESFANPTMITYCAMHRAREGHEAELERRVNDWLEGAALAAGFLGSAVIRTTPGSECCLIVVLQFASRQQLDVWNGGAETQSYLAGNDPHLGQPVQVNISDGATGWFKLPDVPRQQAAAKWKMTFITWLAIFPTLTVFISASFHLLGDMPMIARLLINTIMIAPLMTWVIMPFMTRVFKCWLFGLPRHSRI